MIIVAEENRILLLFDGGSIVTDFISCRLVCPATAIKPRFSTFISVAIFGKKAQDPFGYRKDESLLS